MPSTPLLIDLLNVNDRVLEETVVECAGLKDEATGECLDDSY